MPGLYIHVPFCQKRCHYCSFYSTTYGKRERELYVEALIRELNNRADELIRVKDEAQRDKDDPQKVKDELKRNADDITAHANGCHYKLTSVYFGGGTPSQLDIAELQRIFQAIRQHYNLNDAEITFECNPDDVKPEYAKGLATLGVNRVSMGVQSFDDIMLQTINRRHTAAQVHEALRSFHEADIHSISIDLIYGLPGQTLQAWEQDLDTAIALTQRSDEWGGRPTITHLSSYALSVEEGTHLYNTRARGEWQETDEETSLRMYDMLIDKLTRAGYEHYEISNFALPGFYSRHNSSYWSGAPYLGLGPGAHSYDGANVRRWNTADLRQYISAPAAPHDAENLSPVDLYNEKIITRLRTKEGLQLSTLTADEQRYLKQQARRLVERGLLQTDEHRIALTRSGIFVSDSIFAELMMEV